MNTLSSSTLFQLLAMLKTGVPIFCRTSLMMVLWVLVWLSPYSAKALVVNDVFPDFTSFEMEGSIPDLKGKVVLVDFFASWCSPCKASFPVMQELHKTYGSKGLIIVAINVDDKKEDMKRFLTKHPVDFAIVRDATKKFVSTVKIPSLPSSFLLDRTGRIRTIHQGFRGGETRQKYIDEIESLLR